MTTPNPQATPTPRTDAATFQAQRYSVRFGTAHAQELVYVVPAMDARTLERDLTAAQSALAAKDEEVRRLREALKTITERLVELPGLVLKNERLNPAWSKAELWGIERDVIPAIRALCLATEGVALAALTPPPTTATREGA